MSVLYKLFSLAFLMTLSACGANATLVRSTPPNASVFVDGVLVGVTPLELHLTKETHKIRLEKEGYLPVNDYLSVEHRKAVIGYPYYSWSDNERYVFKPAYDFNLQQGRRPE